MEIAKCFNPDRRVMTPKEFQIFTGYDQGYIYTLNRNGLLQSFKENRRLFFYFDAVFAYISQAHRDLKTGKITRRKKGATKGTIIKMFPKKSDTDAEAIAV